MMSKVYKATVCFLLLLSAGFLLSACNTGKEEKPAQGKTLTLYYLNSEGDGLTEVERSLQETDSVEDEVREIIRLLSEKEDGNEYKSPIYDGVIIRETSVDHNNVNVDFESSYRQLASDKEILLKAALVKSLIQLNGIDEVTFTVGGDTLIGTNDIAIGTMTADSFLTGRDEVYAHKEKATLYFADEDGDQLVEVRRVIDVRDNMPVETGLLYELIHGKPPKGCRNPLPPGLKIHKTLVYNNICYVDLSSEIAEVQPGVDNLIKLYSMVNTLVDRGYASQVRFTVDGEAMPDLNDMADFDQPLTRDYSLVKETRNTDNQDKDRDSKKKDRDSKKKDKDSEEKDKEEKDKESEEKDRDTEEKDKES